MLIHIKNLPYKRILLAVSGGLDSICLADYFIRNQKKLEIQWLGIAHIHHGLRENATKDAEFVENFAHKRQIPFFLKCIDGHLLKITSGSLEENARKQRYLELLKIAIDNNVNAIFTAHHLNDNAETIYMRILRGTSLFGLRGILPFRELSEFKDIVKSKTTIQLVRPFLDVSKEELLKYAKINLLQWVQDESNYDTKFKRNEIRNSIFPYLNKTHPGFMPKLNHIGFLASKVTSKILEKSNILFDKTLDENTELPIPFLEANNCKWIFINRKKLNAIFKNYENSDLSELFRLWLLSKGFRFPIGFFFKKERSSSIQIPSKAIFQSRFIGNFHKSIMICHFKEPKTAQNFVSYLKKLKDKNETKARK